ncbi:MAG: BON domain-containing protein [Betaproteobacteria bacterium]|nr:BON domain-containing protein [Betaproteobacteria bacterium]
MKPFTTALFSARRALLVSAFAIASLTLLQGCVPVMFAGFGAGALMVTDRRTSGTYVEDESIEWKVSDLIRKNFGSHNHVRATSYNRNVLLTGEVQDENVRAEAQRLAGTVANVRTVVNELVIGPASSFSSRSNDAAITSNVKARFVNNKVFSPTHVKVVTEAGVVFLLGIVSRTEGDHASEIASTSKGVKKVVRVFEFVDESEAVNSRSSHGNEYSDEGGFPPEAP